MGFFEELEKSLHEAIEIEKGNLPIEIKEGMPSTTYIVTDKEHSKKKYRF